MNASYPQDLSSKMEERTRSPSPAVLHAFIPFPKITGKLNEFLINMERLRQSGKIHGEQVQIEGTVKLHGMHGDIIYDLSKDNAEVIFQSRNRICDSNESQQGWPRNLSRQTEALASLKTKIIARFESKISNQPVNRTKPLIVAGEWTGPKVQAGVGISRLSARFIILSIQINGIWQRDSDFADIEEPSAAIYNIMRVRPFVVIYNIANRSPTNPALHEMQRLADQVEAACPYAAHFGVAKSRGEGIVWKPSVSGVYCDTKYWFKMKGPISDPVSHIDINSSRSYTAKVSLSAEERAKTWVTPRRVEQAFEYLIEMNCETYGQRERAFTKWMMRDILTEERAEIDAMAANDLTFTKRLRERIYFRARDKFLDGCERDQKAARGFKAASYKTKQHQGQQSEISAISAVAHNLQSLDLIDMAETDTDTRTKDTEVCFIPQATSTVRDYKVSNVWEATVPGVVVAVDKATECTEKPSRELTNEERFLKAMEKMLKR